MEKKKEDFYKCTDLNSVKESIEATSEQLAELLVLGYQLELSLSRSGFKVYKMKKQHHTLTFKTNNSQFVEV